MRAIMTMAALGLLVACAPQLPESGAGFDTSIDDALAQDAAIDGARTGAAVPPPKVISQEPLAAVTPVPVVAATPTAPQTPAVTRSASSTGTADDIARETQAALTAAAANSGQAPVQASPSNPAPQTYKDPGLSDENDFQAVSARESIQSDAARLAENKGSYTVVDPVAVPERPGDTGPNIVSYALSSNNQPGTRVYSRSGINLSGKAARNCAKYPSPDQAQMEFLALGGPERDRKGLDPDGDGFACSWDPTPFRMASKN